MCMTVCSCYGKRGNGCRVFTPATGDELRDTVVERFLVVFFICVHVRSRSVAQRVGLCVMLHRIKFTVIPEEFDSAGSKISME